VGVRCSETVNRMETTRAFRVSESLLGKEEKRMKNPGLAAVLSFFIIGLG